MAQKKTAAQIRAEHVISVEKKQNTDIAPYARPSWHIECSCGNYETNRKWQTAARTNHSLHVSRQLLDAGYHAADGE